MSLWLQMCYGKLSLHVFGKKIKLGNNVQVGNEVTMSDTWMVSQNVIYHESLCVAISWCLHLRVGACQQK